MGKLLTLPKILMLIGASWIIIFSLLYMNQVINYNFYGWKESGTYLIFIGIIYILIPFAIKPGIWEKLWAILISVISVLIVMGLLIGPNVDYKSSWTYINALPHILMMIGSFLLIIKSK